MADQSDVCIVFASLGAALQSNAAKPPILVRAVDSRRWVLKILDDSAVAVLVVTDPDLALEEYADVWGTIERYTLAGGSTVLAGRFYVALGEHADVWDTIERYTLAGGTTVLAGRFYDAPILSLPASRSRSDRVVHQDTSKNIIMRHGKGFFQSAQGITKDARHLFSETSEIFQARHCRGHLGDVFEREELVGVELAQLGAAAD
ncbi:hypothetical protein B0T24DRAFT_683477 [Lasiosphaeria ovina]|uniref:Uncharacterized protein n=1 Tax=Lasiosphaeria ovina TaxID=92902 RepID=A0AAE0MZ25_9PEZI|nr:hypothetical protein B0T24DRAFT_683477 [Lasiosphaeria ovina]